MTTTMIDQKTAPAVRPLGVIGLAGGILTVLGAGYEQAFGLWDNNSVDGFFVVQAVAIVLTIASVIGLLRSDVPTNLATRLALRAAALGLVVFAAGHFLGGFHPASEDTPLMPVGGMFSTVGMLVAGVLVLKAGRWTGNDRFTPLLCGLYPIVILIPAFVIFGDGNMPAIVGFGVVWALFGAAVARLGD
jgi:hypothetical protein